MSSCVMGKSSDLNKVVGSDIRVDGLRGLRIANMSVCSILTSNHTQISVHLIGEMCVELLQNNISFTAPTARL
jgi:choline dehydrogenase-like flavoprotein